VRVDVGLALGFAVAALAWATLDGLPGQRWVAVHLFTLGVLTPLIVAFSREQVRTLLRVVPRGDLVIRSLLTIGALGVATGMVAADATAGSAPPAWPAATIAVGGMLSILGVAVALVGLVRARREAGTDVRFDWLLRTYVHAHALFVVGAPLGALLGAGFVPAEAYVAVRFGHLHALPVGFAALTLLATVVLYGPMLLRAQLSPQAEAAARRWLPRASLGAVLAIVGLLARALPAPADRPAGWVAAAGLAVVALTAAVTLRHLGAILARKRGDSPLVGVLLSWAIVWLTIALTADAVVVATGSWRLLDAVGLVAFVGAFAQAIAATLGHVLTMYLPRARRLRLYPRLDATPIWLTVLPQVAVGVLAGAAVA
jgi:hypothetical protein